MAIGWNEIVTKLSWLAIPIGMTTVSIRNPKAFINLILLCNVALLIFIVNSSIIYFSDRQEHIETYMLYTTKYKDHIRFSLSVTLLLIINTYCIFQQRAKFKYQWVYLLLIIVSIYYVLFLHILSARTGLACLYVFLIAFIFYKLWLYKKWISIIGSIAIVAIGMLAIKYVPRLNYKIAYMQYELRQWREAEESVQYTLSDNNRMLSYTVALSSIQQHPLLGVGIGDIQDEMVAIYNQKYPSIPSDGALKLPHNQWLATAMATGVISCILLLVVLLSPLRMAYQHRYYLCLRYSLVYSCFYFL